MRPTRSLAHAFSPWEWRSRASVVALVVLASVAMVVGPVLILTNGAPLTATVIGIATGEALVYFAGLRPALRSLRRWDECHAAESPSRPSVT